MINQSILELTGTPGRIKKLSSSQLDMLAGEIRDKLVSTVSQTGGHLASNLGVVELTIALLRCFDVPNDKIVWDVGHQCYPYKLLTGRQDDFSTLRQEGGLSGFPKSSESIYDAFLAGHASTSIAAAFGLERAMALRGDAHHAVAVIGDGAMTGGMAYEGLNNAGKDAKNLIIILNDNEMAISKNEGALARYLSVIRSRPGYFKVKRITDTALRSIPIVGGRLRDFVAESKSIVKQAIYPNTFFEEFGFVYLGPVDGHNIKSLCDVLTQAKTLDGPSLIHVKTKKGKGYCHAERNPGAFHGISKFDVKTGEPYKASGESFSSVFGDELLRLAHENKKVCAITAAMEHGTGLKNFSREFKGTGRYYDIGIAEGFGVTFSAALGAGGMIPVFAVYSTFLQRGYDQLIHDAAIERQHVVFGVDRAGIVGDDGETHQGIFDPAFLSTVPGIELLAPANYAELRAMLRRAVNDCTGPVAVRYPRGGEDPLIANCAPTGAAFDHFDCGQRTCAIVTYGRTFAAAQRAADQAKTPVSIIKLNRIIPIDPAAIAAACRYERVVVIEEAWGAGGVASQFLAGLALAGYQGKSELRAIDGFVAQSSVERALHHLGLDSEGILKLIDGGTDDKETTGSRID